MANNYYINQSKCYTSVIFTKYCIGQSVHSSFSIKKLCNKSLAIKRRLRTLIGRTSFLGTGVFWTDLAALDPSVDILAICLSVRLTPAWKSKVL